MMPVTASQVFDALNRYEARSVEKVEVFCPDFAAVRRSLRQIFTSLQETDEEAACTCRRLLYEWLTLPVPFDLEFAASLKFLGEFGQVQQRWGGDVGQAYRRATASLTRLQNTENPVRVHVRRKIETLFSESQSFRIYCHRGGRSYFESILHEVADDVPVADSFLHTVTEYRNSEPFDVLVKVGPLRSKGYGSAPDSLKSAPRFGKIVQVAWSGCSDEQDFGLDPISSATGAVTTLVWTPNVERVGDESVPPEGVGTPVDEFTVLGEAAGERSEGLRKATLVQIGDQMGILFPPQSRVVSLDLGPGVDRPFDFRRPGETLTEGMFVAPVNFEADLSELQVRADHYSERWKNELRDKLDRDPHFYGKLRIRGIKLQNLDSCVRDWCKPTSTVIHAPQSRKHFRILIELLGIEHPQGSVDQGSRPWWESAWDEIRYSRGKAIQKGHAEHEKLSEGLLKILTDLLPAIRERLQAKTHIKVTIPKGEALAGGVEIMKVWSIEQGFSVPEETLHVPKTLGMVEQWRD
jgi:hypothetical protein